jgi:purine-binding chemotaxis protein CheW
VEQVNSRSPLAAAAGMATASARAAEQGQYLTFLLAGEVFAIGILGIKEIIEYEAVTAVPMMPAYMRGVINLRGAVVPVADLGLRFGKSSSEVTKRTCIVIVELEMNEERQVFGLVVDAVNAVVDIPAAEIEPPPTFGSRIRADFIFGMGKVGGRSVIILNVDHVLAAEEMEVLAAAVQS